MARLRVFDLPTQVVGDVVENAFMLVLDKMGDQQPGVELAIQIETTEDRIRTQTGARAVLTFADEIEFE